MLKKYGLLVFPLLFLAVLRFGFNFNGLYGQDSYEYLRYSGRLLDYFKGGNLPGDYFWPIGFPFYGALLGFVFHDVSFALQLISTLSFIGIIWFGKKILDFVYPHVKGKYFYLIVFLIFSPFLLRSSIVCMSDAGATFFVLGFFYHFLKFRKNESAISLIWLFVFAANAFMFRYVSLVLFVVPSIYLFRQVLVKKHLLTILAGVGVFFLFILPHLVIRSSNPVSFLHHEWLTEWSFGNYFHSSFATADGQSTGILPNVIYSLVALFHPGNFIFGSIALLFLFKQDSILVEEKIFLCSVLLYVLFLAGMPIQNLRFYLVALPLLILVSYRGFYFIYLKLNQNWIKILFVGSLLFQSFLFVYGFRLMYSRNQLEVSIKEWISKNTTQQIIYSFDMDVSLKSGGLNRTFYNLWEKEYQSFLPNSLVLFNAPAFEKQWKGKNPMKNWEKLNAQNNIQLIKSFPQGWSLYEIR